VKDLEIGKMSTAMDNISKEPEVPADIQLKRKWILDLISEFRCAVEEDLDIFFKMTECEQLMFELQHHIGYLKQKVDKYTIELKKRDEIPPGEFDERKHIEKAQKEGEERLTLAIETTGAGIYDKKQIEELLYERKEQLRVIASCTCAWESWIGCDGKLIWVNSTVEHMTGYSPYECIKMEDYPFPIIAPEDRIRMAEVFESESANDVEFRVQKKDGSVIWVAISWQPIYDNADKWLGYLTSVRDINKRRQAEEALRKERDKAQKYLDIVGVMILALDANQTVTLINKKGCDVLGYNEDEIIGKNWFDDFLPDNIKDDVKSVYNKLMAGEIEPVEYFENPVITRNGTKRTILWHNAILKDESNHIIGVLSSGADITDRKKAEEEIIQTLHEKEMLLQEIHHRVKNNLLVLYGLISFQQAALGDERRVTEILESTKQRIQAMGRVHQMLYKTKNLSEIDFSEYVRSMVEELLKTYNVSEKRIEVALDLDPVMLSIETAVPCGLIMNELLVNACKHAFPDKKFGHITISLTERGDVKELCISDNGVGLSEPLIFDEAKTLGMRFISMLTRQLKGEISYKNEKGSVFTLIFKTTRKKGV
jgi:PAS domain S-box-containing protein